MNEQQDSHQGKRQLSLGMSPAESRSGVNDLCSDKEVTVNEQEGHH